MKRVKSGETATVKARYDFTNEFDVPDLVEWGFNASDFGIASEGEEVKNCTCPNCGHQFPIQ